VLRPHHASAPRQGAQLLIRTANSASRAVSSPACILARSCVICPKHTPDIRRSTSLSYKRIHASEADIYLTAPPIYRDVGERWRNASLGIRRLKTRRRLETISIGSGVMP